jgi:hypothetical protein
MGFLRQLRFLCCYTGLARNYGGTSQTNWRLCAFDAAIALSAVSAFGSAKDFKSGS